MLKKNLTKTLIADYFILNNLAHICKIVITFLKSFEKCYSELISTQQINQEVGTGLFSDFSSVQSVNISGVVNSLEPNAGTITYRQEMVYLFSCRYPLQYLVNNTEMSV